MNATTIDIEVRDYLAEVKEHLSDLPDDELDDLTIDLEAHLVEVHAEGGRGLATRLGSPAAYAAELRASAGFDRLRPRPPRLAERLRAVARDLADNPTATRAREAWAAARPVWIGVRGWLLIAMWLTLSADALPFQIFPIPHLGSTLVGLGAVVLATALSYAAAGRAQDDERWRLADAGYTAAVVLMLLVAVSAGAVLTQPRGVVVEGPSEEEILANYPMVGVTNIFAYDLDGRPLEAVLLFDQTGSPLDLNPWVDTDTEEIRFLEDRFGEPIKNAYPVRQFRYVEETLVGETGVETYETRLEPVPPPRVPLPNTEDGSGEEPPTDPLPETPR